MRSNTIFAAGFVAASAVMAAPVEVRAENAPLLPISAASQGVQTESTGPLIPTTSASQAPLTTETTGPLIPTTSASQGAQTTETTGPLIPTTTASGSASASHTGSASSSAASGSSTGTASHSSTASGSGTATSSGTATNTSTASSSSGTGTATHSASGSSTGTASSSSTGSATGTATSTASGTATHSASGSGTNTGIATSTGPAPTGTQTITVGPPVTTATPPPQVLTVLTTITEDFTEYVTYVPVTITGGSGSETITVTKTVTEQNTVTVDGNGNGCAPTGTSTQIVPPPNPTGSGGSFYPSDIYHYDVSTGAITCGVKDGLIEKFPANKGHDITTLVTFTYPEESAGKKCQFEFFLSSASTLEGSGKIDVFTSLAPAPGCKASWPPGNQRNVHAGRLSAHVGAFATWDATYGASYLTEPTDCKAPGTQEGIELVGVYDEDHVSWFPDGSGARIIYN